MTLAERLIRHAVYPLDLWRTGDHPQLKYLRFFERSQFWSAQELSHYQLKQLRRLLDHAYRECAFYRRRFQAAGIVPNDIKTSADLEALPVLQKQDIQHHHDAMIADSWPRHDLIQDQTGGSTGCPISFCYSHDRKCSRAAAAIRHNRWAGWDVGTKVAYIWGAPRDLPLKNWKWQIRSRILDRHLILDSGRLTVEKMTAFHRSLKRFRPRIITAYAQSAVLFARFLQNSGEHAYQPQAIVTSAEVLGDSDRALLQNVFGCRVFNRYGSREVSVIASECSAHRGLHTMAEGLLIEVVANGRQAQPGESGAILVTDLLNFAMPMIRYRIGDVGAWAVAPCRCGRQLPLLQHVTGRTTDFVVGADGRMVSGVFLATYVVAQRPSLGQVQIDQVEAGQMLYRIRPGRGFDAKTDLEYLTTETRRYLGDALNVEFEFVEELAPEPSGKFAFCRSKVVPDFLSAPAPSTSAELAGSAQRNPEP